MVLTILVDIRDVLRERGGRFASDYTDNSEGWPVLERSIDQSISPCRRPNTESQ